MPGRLATVALLLASKSALACPECPTAIAARAQAFGDDFWSTLAAALLPLVVIGAVAASSYRVGLPRKERSDER